MFNLISKPEQMLLDKPKKRPNIFLKPGRIKRLTNPGNVYATTAAPGNLPVGTRANYQLPEYDLGEVARVMDIEAYVRQAFDKHTELCLKEGWKLVSRNKEAADYIDKRLGEIGEASGRTFKSLLRGIISNTVIFANCFIVKARKASASSGMPRKDAGGATLEPVAGYFLIDPTSVNIKRNLHGTVTKYRQIIPGIGDIPEFWPEDMIHIFYDRKEGFAFGTPYVIPVLDDIRTLRRLEENVEMLTVAHLYPLFQYKVGTENHPAEVYEDGTTEVDLIKTEIENMPTEGSIVTPDRHEIKAIGAEGEALDVSKYLEHFEKRVLSGLGVSDIALGRGGTSNRATAASIDKSMQDRCKEFQEVVSDFINEYMIKELLLEGGFMPQEDNNDVVRLVFNEIDIDTQIKAENHTVFKYEHDIITESEAREDLGKDPLTEEQRNDLYFEHVTKPKAIIMAVDEPYCYSKDAEILTLDGWKSFVDVTMDDSVATLSNGMDLVYEKPKKIYSLKHDGKMYFLKTRFLDICVTPNHKLYTCDRNRKDSDIVHEFKLEHAENLFGKYKKFKRSAVWNGNDVDTIGLPELKRDIEYSSKKYFPGRNIKSDDWVKFIGWYLSEGCSSHENGAISISQSLEIHPDNYGEIESVLSNIGVNYNKYDGEIKFSDFQIKEYLHKECGIYSVDKRVPREVKGMSSRLLNILLETMMKGDGEIIYHYLYSTISKQLADDVQEIALKCGFAANIRVEAGENRCNDIYRVTINRDKYVDVADRTPGCGLSDSSVEKYIDYNDMVYCVETSSGVVYVRQNGKARWCGNTAEAKAAAGSKGGAAIAKISKEEKKKKETVERNQPSNQHGRKMAKTTVKKDQLLKEAIEDIKKISGLSEMEDSKEVAPEIIEPPDVTRNPMLISKLRFDLKNYWDLTKEDVLDYVKETYIEENRNLRDFTPEKLKMILFLTKDSIVKKSGIYMFQALNDGARKSARDGGREEINLSFDPTVKYQYLNERIEYYTTSLLSDLGTHLVKNINPDFSDNKDLREIRSKVIPKIMGIFDALEYRLNFTSHTEIMKAYNFGYALAARDMGYKEIYIKLAENSCDKCRVSAEKPLSLEFFSFEDVAPVHPMCNCTYTIRR